MMPFERLAFAWFVFVKNYTPPIYEPGSSIGRNKILRSKLFLAGETTDRSRQTHNRAIYLRVCIGIRTVRERTRLSRQLRQLRDTASFTSNTINKLTGSILWCHKCGSNLLAVPKKRIYRSVRYLLRNKR